MVANEDQSVSPFWALENELLINIHVLCFENVQLVISKDTNGKDVASVKVSDAIEWLEQYGDRHGITESLKHALQLFNDGKVTFQDH